MLSNILLLVIERLEHDHSAVGEIQDRKLAAIMFTDIVGYTSLTQANEIATMKLLENHRSLLRPIFSSHKGREVKTIGDAFLVEFSSSLEAVSCAIDIQKAISERNLQEEPVQIRIGIHVGEVIHANNDDVYGDAVNIASRIEPIAEPGGICVSRQVFEFVENKVEAQFARLGSVDLKNVKLPLEIYKVLPSVPNSMTMPGNLKKRVAVLPFDNFSQEPGTEYFADGLTEEMIGTLSKIKELSVISRTSVMQYKNKPKLIPEISRELKAGTILEGSVRKAGNRARVSIQMIDATEDKHLWAENYDRNLEDIFEVQSDIAERVAEALKVELLDSEKQAISEAPTKSAEANLLYLRGVDIGNNGSPSDVLRAIEYIEKAIKTDPSFALAYATASYFQVGVAGEAVPGNVAFPKAQESLRRALELNPNLSEAHTAKGWLEFQLGWDWKASENAFRKALEINPSSSRAHDGAGITFAALHRFDEAISAMNRASELDPLSPWVATRKALVYHIAGRNREARDACDIVVESRPSFGRVHLVLAYINVAEGKKEDAIREAERAAEISDEAYIHCYRAIVYASFGESVKAREILENLLAGRYKGYASPGIIGSIYYALGDNDKGYEQMIISYNDRDPTIPWTCNWPILKKQREDTRFVELLEKLHLS